MVISFTSSPVTPEQGREVDEFLGEFLPRMKAQQPGVVAIYTFTKTENGEQVTAIIWSDEEARAAYLDSELIKEVGAFEERMGVPVTRESYPVTLALSGDGS